MTCDAATIKPLSVCLECLSPKQLRANLAYLTCQYANKPTNDDMKIQATSFDNFELVNDAVDSVSFPNLTAITSSGTMRFALCPAQTILDLHNLTTVGSGSINISGCDNLALINLSSLTGLIDNGGGWTINNNQSLTSILLNSGITFDNGGQNWDFSHNAFDATTVNLLLALFLASAVTSLTIDLSGGTNSPPTGQGLVNKTALLLLGNTVTTN